MPLDPPASAPMPPKYLLRLSRPRFWPYLFGPYIVGLVAGAPAPQALLDWRVALFAVFFLFPANLFVYGVNDVYDGETDARNSKKDAYEARVGAGQRLQLLRVCWAWVIPFVGIAAASTSWRAVAALGLFLFLSHQYSAPPIRAKARPFVDSAFNLLYACPAAFAYALAGGESFRWPWALAAWAWCAAMHAYSAVPDITADRAASVPTIATALGLRATLLVCAALYALAAGLSSSGLGWLSLALGAVYAVMMALSLRAGTEAGVMKLYRFFPAINTAAGFVLFWAIACIRFESQIRAAWPL